ncbi:MAG: NACHT domain-containing protein [Acidobacteriota bacterium]
MTNRMLRAKGHYRRLLAEDKSLRHLSLAGLAPDDEPILLREIYVPLILTPLRISEDEREGKVHDQGRTLEDWIEPPPNPEPDDPVAARPEVTCFFISGEAGSGKTTLVRSAVASLAGRESDGFNHRIKELVPFPILLREAPLAQLEGLEELVRWWLDEVETRHPEEKPPDRDALLSFLEAGLGLLILDGLDEVGDQLKRGRIIDWLRRHPWVGRGGPQNSSNVVLVTARPSGYQDLDISDFAQARMLHVAPFSTEQIRSYLTLWFELRPLPPKRREESVNSLVARLTDEREHGRLRPLARRPAYLAALAFVHGARGAVPHSRATLYQMLVDAYLDALDRYRGLEEQRRQEGLLAWDRQEKLEVLSAVAFQAHLGLHADSEEGAKGRWVHPEGQDRRLAWRRDELQEAVRQGIA